VIHILVRTATVALACGALLGSLAVPAAADRDYRTQQYEVSDDTGAVVGFVVNIHAEGPVNYGIERYHLKKVEAGTYQVSLQVHADPGCTFPVLPPFLTTTVRTNAVGNAHGGAVFSAADVAQIVFEPVTVWAIWTFTRGDGLTYSTDCVPLTLDVP
jgi:hypothetical protein